MIPARPEFRAPDTRACLLSHCGIWAIHPMTARQALGAIRQGLFVPRAALPGYVPEPLGPYTWTEDGEAYNTHLLPGGIAVLPVHDMTMKGRSKYGGTSTLDVRQAIRAASAAPEVRGIVLHISSPGGHAFGTSDLADDIREAGKTKPVWAYGADMVASAAYWIGSQTARFSAGRTAQIGSIGTYAVIDDMSGAYEKAGIEVHVLSTGPFKGAGIEGAEVTAEHLADWQRNVDELNAHFLAAVAAGRKATPEAVAAWATGQVWQAAEARSMGLIDAVESFDACLDAMRAALGSPAATAVPPPARAKSFAEAFPANPQQESRP